MMWQGVGPFFGLAMASVLVLPPLLRLLFAWTLRSPSACGKGTSKKPAREDAGADDGYENPVSAAYVQDGGAARLVNPSMVETVESEVCSTRVMLMHRPTHELWRDRAGRYPFAAHLAGRKRLWEVRLQLRFKKVPTGKMYLALSSEKYFKISHFAQAITTALIQGVKRVIPDVYVSEGDNPAHAPLGEAELPLLALPLWAFDQFVVSEPGEEPPITGSFEGLGMKRTDDVAAYVKAMESVVENLSTGKVYTFLFWGLSRFMDLIKWQYCVGGFIPGLSISINAISPGPPVFLSMYELLDNGSAVKDRRHLASKKRHCVKFALWSLLHPPKPEALEQLLGRPVRSEHPAVKMEPRADGQCLSFCHMLRGRGPQRRGGNPKSGMPRSLWSCWAIH